jgi:hypothetical protein
MARTREPTEGPVATVLKIEGGLPDLPQGEDDEAGESVVQMQAPTKASG